MLTSSLSSRVHNSLFVLFCSIVFSKIVWYDIRVYIPAAERRAFLTDGHLLWILAQYACFAVMALPLLRVARDLWRVIAFWVAMLVPYFVIGLLDDRASLTFMAGDVARYGLPVGFLVFFAHAARTLDGRTILVSLATILGVCVATRTIIHLEISGDALMRYGLTWEVFLVCLAVAAGAMARSWRLLLLALGLCALAAVFAGGLFRAMLLGSAIAGVATAALGWWSVPGRRLPVAALAVVAVAAMLFPTIFRVQDSGRLLLARTITATVPPVTDQAADLAGPGEEVEETPSRLQLAKERWERAVIRGSLSLEIRISETLYFIEVMRQDLRLLLFGPGAGWSVTLDTAGGEEPVVRGAHNTYVTLAFRHGLLFGLPLIAFVLCYGLRENLRQIVSAPSVHWRVLLIALVGYRVTAAIMAHFRQGLFDDPIVFLSIALATSPALLIPKSGAKAQPESAAGVHRSPAAALPEEQQQR